MTASQHPQPPVISVDAVCERARRAGFFIHRKPKPCFDQRGPYELVDAKRGTIVFGEYRGAKLMDIALYLERGWLR
jgi:hypothetical protein